MHFYSMIHLSTIVSWANNVVSTRTELQKKQNIITYGCLAHFLNLLASGISIPNVKEHMQITKYFRNNHIASAKLKEKLSKLILPQNMR